MQIELIPSLVGLIVAMGGGAGFLKLVEGLIKIRSGMSAKESSRKVDIVKQRDEAIANESKAWRLVDAEAKKRRDEQEYSARLRRQIIALGGEPDPEPVHEKTITKAQLQQLQKEEHHE